MNQSYSQDDRRGASLVLRYTPSGAPDLTFGPKGSRVLAMGPGHEAAARALVQPDGRILVAGRGWSPAGGPDLGVVRLLP